MNSYNDNNKILDWPRIRKLFIIGLFAACIALIADILLGWGMADKNLSGIEGMLSQYINLSDSRIFWSSLLGLIGISIEGLCYFGIYRLIVPYSEKYAHHYRAGILGYLMFAACGVHVPCLSSVFFYKYMSMSNPNMALELSIRYGSYFLLPGIILLEIFFIVLCVFQIIAFIKEKTPYPSWCWIFNIPIGMIIAVIPRLIIETPFTNAISAGWISVGNIWMFMGLLVTMNKARKDY